MDEAAQDGPQSSAAINCQLALLAIRLRRLDPPATGRPAPRDRRTDLSLVQRFLSLAGDHLSSDRTISDMAEELGTDATTLDRTCLAVRGRRAVQLVHDLRLERAVQALRHSQRPLDMIAKDLGYTSLAHLNRAFVAATGRLPAIFRIEDPLRAPH